MTITSESLFTSQEPTDAQPAAIQKPEWQTPQLTQIDLEDTKTGLIYYVVEATYVYLPS